MAKKKMEPIKKDDLIKNEEANTESVIGNPTVIDLNDVAYFIMVGRFKNGEPFFTHVNVNDWFIVDGLIEYAKRNMDITYQKALGKVDGGKSVE